MSSRSIPGSTENNKIYNGMEHLILCEGIDAWKFIVNFLNSDAMSIYPDFSRTIQVENFGGNNQLQTKLQLWTRSPGFEHIRSLIIIRDAESDAVKAIHSIIRDMKKVGLPVPNGPQQLAKDNNISTGFLLFPTLSSDLQNGAIEDLCLTILKETELSTIEEIDDFLESLKQKDLRKFPRIFKTRLHTYFSVTDKYVSLKIGEAADAGAFDWGSVKLTPLRDFLLQFIE